jgi:hypothetical protein
MPSYYDMISDACKEFLWWSSMLIVARVLKTGKLISHYTSHQVALSPERCRYFTLDHTTSSSKFRDCVIIPFCKMHSRVPKASKGTISFSCCVPVDVSALTSSAYEGSCLCGECRNVCLCEIIWIRKVANYHDAFPFRCRDKLSLGIAVQMELAAFVWNFRVTVEICCSKVPNTCV